ncbi:MAG: sugar ABC transporter ATP-binding protein [Desulfobacterales bacterium]|nr:MAG: sugar ABC transporter ATP-binding protein [Desulfobacterales bacterium]
MSQSCILDIHHIEKKFGGVNALQGVDLQVYEGEVHGIVGENGAGKSTLMKILGREIKENKGSITYRGESINDLSPWEIQKLGMMTVHQDLNVVGSLNIGQNILLGNPPTNSWGLLNWKAGYPEAKKALKFVSNSLSIEQSAAKLSAAQSQLVILARALAQKPKVLILDEPTARLGLEETAQLFTLLKVLIQEKVTIIYISHRLEEIYRVCDRVTVLRDGLQVLTAEISEISQEELVRQMIGREVEQFITKRKTDKGKTAVEVRNLTYGSVVKNLSFSIKAGELVGLVGAVGAGKSEVLQLIFGAKHPDSGEILIGSDNTFIQKPADAFEAGIAYLPEDRSDEGLVMDFAVRENLTLVNLRSFSQLGFIKRKKEQQKAFELIDRLQIKTPDPDTSVKFLSGGNQQKVVLGKWVAGSQKVFLLDEVTAGIDIGAKFEIYELIGNLIEAGTAVMLSTSDIQEAMGLCDRLLIMHRGSIVSEVIPEATTREAVLMNMMGGGVHNEVQSR